MVRSRVCRPASILLAGVVVLSLPGRGWSAAEVKFDKDFLSGLIEKVPPCPFKKEDRYRGTVQAFRLVAIDPKAREFLVACQVVGEFRPPGPKLAGFKGARGEGPTDHWKSFRFDVKTSVNIEPGRDGSPRFRVEVDEVKRRELEGITGVLAKLLGKSFDQIVTQVADGKTSQLGEKLNAEIKKRVKMFQEYGVFCAMDYSPTEIVLHFDVTRLRSEGITGYVYPAPQPGTVPLTRWFHPRLGHHHYTINPEGLAQKGYVSEGIACYVFPEPTSGTVPLYRWRSRREPYFSTVPTGEGLARFGFRPEGVACAIYPEPKPDTIPFYQFVDPGNGLHFYTTHKYAEFAK